MGNNLYRLIPNMDEFMKNPVIRELIYLYGKSTVIGEINDKLGYIRGRISEGASEEEVEEFIALIPKAIKEQFDSKNREHFKKVINATGVVLHTNLGRAPLCREMVENAVDKMAGYSNLEFDLFTGKRGERYSHFEELICKITGAEAALVVNNNASATLLMLAAVGSGGEVIVSRGEQVEIGGKFRVPDIMDLSGCKRIEVGTTNKTRISDYENSITEHTRALLKVHTSNFKIEGFAESTSREELVELGRKRGLPVLEDLGSGILIDLSKFGLKKEPTVWDSISRGIDLVCFSGDKLLGGPQAGIIVGKKELISKCKQHPFTRAMRIDKFTVAVLEQLFLCYEDEYKALQKIPTLRMLTESIENIQNRTGMLIEALNMKRAGGFSYEAVRCEGVAGGGSLPGEILASSGVELTYKDISAQEAANRLRNGREPVVCRIVADKLLLDMRTVFEEDIDSLAEAISEVV